MIWDQIVSALPLFWRIFFIRHRLEDHKIILPMRLCSTRVASVFEKIYGPGLR
jgi:hypothetical protein